MEQQTLTFSKKQLEYIKKANHRWNGKIGATQCGKTYIDVTYVIPSRIIERKGQAGLNVIFGVSRDTIRRNIIEPLQEYWGTKLIGDVNSRNECVIFGETVHCLGTEKANQVSKIRGARIKYAYVDEICEMNDEVFEMLKSRLSLPYSMCDFTANPKSPTHYIKQFIDRTDLDIYTQHWSIFDNPFLPKKYVEELCKEYAGSIFYDRYILGKWKRAEGCIYQQLADNTQEYIIQEKDLPKRITKIGVGVDFGGNKSAHAFACLGYSQDMRHVYVLETKTIKEQVNPEQLSNAFVEFAKMIYNKYGQAFETYYDNAEPVLARGMAVACERANVPTILRGAWKKPILDRIRLETTLIGAKRIHIVNHCQDLIDAMQEAIWNEKKQEDERLDDGTYCVDILDATEYVLERDMKTLIDLK